MLQKNVQWFVDRLAERLVPTIGSFVASALQRMLVLNHAEHHNQLEEQALRYEASGKPEIARLIREQAKELNLDKPLPVAQQVLEDFGAENPMLFEATQTTAPLAISDSSRKNRLKKRFDESPLESDGDAS